MGLKHCSLVKHPNRTNPRCAVCKEFKTPFYCGDCGPGTPLCFNFKTKDCILRHMLDKVTVNDYAQAKAENGLEDLDLSQP